jgi:hypothetical protein
MMPNVGILSKKNHHFKDLSRAGHPIFDIYQSPLIYLEALSVISTRKILQFDFQGGTLPDNKCS